MAVSTQEASLYGGLGGLGIGATLAPFTGGLSLFAAPALGAMAGGLFGDDQNQELLRLLALSKLSSGNPYLGNFGFNPYQVDPSMFANQITGKQSYDLSNPSASLTNPISPMMYGVGEQPSMSPWIKYGGPLAGLGLSAAGAYFAGQSGRDDYKKALAMLNRSGSYSRKERQRVLRETRSQVRGGTRERLAPDIGGPAQIFAEEGILANVAKNFDEAALQHYLAKAQLKAQQPDDSAKWLQMGTQFASMLPFLLA